MSDYRNYQTGDGEHVMVDLDGDSALSFAQVNALIDAEGSLVYQIRRDSMHLDKIVRRINRSAEAKLRMMNND